MDKNDDYIQIFLPKKLKKWLREYAKKTNRSMNGVIRHLLEKKRNADETTIVGGKNGKNQ